MRKSSFIIFVMSWLALCAFATPAAKQLFRIEQAGPETLQLVVQAGLEIDQVRGLGSASAWQPRGMAEIDLWLTEGERARLEASGVRLVAIPDLAREMWLAEQGVERDERLYHDHEALTAYLQGVAASHPDICRLNSIGLSVQGRELWVLTISDNPDEDEDEPEFKYVSTIHGDEVVGVELLLFLIDEIVEGYGTDPRMTNIVDNVELHILPLMNPDGNANGTRNNADGVNLNRDFPDPYTSPSNTPTGRAVETGLVMEWTFGHNFDLGANFHGGAMVVNYPYDNNPGGNSVYTISPDDDLYIEMSEDYTVGNIPMWNGDFFHGITNGAAWYAISGGMQDWNYRYQGCMAVTIELYDIKWPNYNVIPGLWNDNREGMLTYLEWCLKGVRGIVTNSVSGDPLGGVEVQVVGRDHTTLSSAGIGDYHRILPAGTWALEFSKAGYQSQTISGVAVAGNGATVLDVALVPLVAAPDFALGSVVVPDANGALDPGETGPILVELVNAGTMPAHGVVVGLECSSPWITVLHQPETIGDLAVEQAVELSLGLAVDAAAPLGETVDFTLVVESDELDESLSFSLSIGRIVEDFESGNFLLWPWTQGGDQPWVLSHDTPSGVWCATSGTITHNQDSQMTLALNLISDGTLSFDCRVSSEASYDYLRVLVDGDERLALAGEVPWHTESVGLTAGPHAVTFLYEKDVSVSDGSDRAWVDEIVLPPQAPVAMPCLQVSPSAVDVELLPGGQTQASLLLENCGEVDLVWTAQLSLDDPARLEAAQRVPVKRGKGEPDDMDAPAHQRDAGGPDAFGYTWQDSAELGGPAFDWLDASAVGVDAGTGDDTNLGPFELGFEFPFYGSVYSQVRIDTNGYLNLVGTTSVYGNAPIPTAAAPNALIAPFWDDLDPGAGGTLHVWADPASDLFVAQWTAVRHYGGANPETFQAQLRGDGTILFQYETVSSAGSCTAGIENGAGSDGLQLSYNSAGVLAAGLAVRFDPPLLEEPWAALGSTGGTISAGSSQALDIALDATDLLPGTYTGTIRLLSNDPEQPQLDLPLTLLVIDPTLDAIADLTVECQAGQIWLHWTAVPGAALYRIETTVDPYAGPWTVAGQTPDVDYAAGACTPGPRCYRVIATN